jgi:rubrerythrin
VFKLDAPKPGLSLFPSRDAKILDGQQKSDEHFYVCRMCGKTAETEKEKNGHCQNCGCENWEEAII